MMDNVHFSHQTDHWSTPSDILAVFKDYRFYDPCPLHAKDGAFNSLWPTMTFCNPPYSDIRGFVDWFVFSFQTGSCSDCWFLVPARTDTIWFSLLARYAIEFVFITGRLKFNDASNPAPFPSVLVHCGPQSGAMPYVHFVPLVRLPLWLREQFKIEYGGRE